MILTNNAPATGKDWTSRNDAAMAPDKGFTKQLKKLNPDYEVVWNWGWEKWAIWCWKQFEEPYDVLTVQTKDKNYRKVGQDIIIKLTEYSWKRYSAKELADYFDEMDRQEQRRKEKDFMNKIESITLDTFRWQVGIPQFQVPKQYLVDERGERIKRCLEEK